MWGVGLRTASFKIDFLKTKTDRQDRQAVDIRIRIDYIYTLQTEFCQIFTTVDWDSRCQKQHAKKRFSSQQRPFITPRLFLFLVPATGTGGLIFQSQIFTCSDNEAFVN